MLAQTEEGKRRVERNESRQTEAIVRMSDVPAPSAAENNDDNGKGNADGAEGDERKKRKRKDDKSWIVSRPGSSTDDAPAPEITGTKRKADAPIEDIDGDLSKAIAESVVNPEVDKPGVK